MRITGLIALLLLAGNLQAHEGDGVPGLYFGVNGGGGNFTGKPDVDGLTVEVGDTTYVWGGYIGYKTYSGQMTFALEADYMTYSGETELVSDGLNYQIKTGADDSYSINALIGYMAAENVELYTRFGYGKTNVNIEYGSLNNPDKKDESFKMPVAGIGVRFGNDTSLGLRLEYRHHFNSDYKMDNGQDFESSGNIFLAGLDYSF